jgi:hypothetical protein
LGHVLRQVRVAADLSQRGRINEVDVLRHEFAECRFGAGFGVAAQELCIAVHVLFILIAPAKA